MGLVAKDNGGGDFQVAPAGTHLARCIKLIDLGTQYSEVFHESYHRCLLSWELPEEEITEGQYSGQPFVVSKEYTLSLGSKANLRKDLQSWRGREFTKEELDGFDLVNILDKTCMLSIVHTTSKSSGKIWPSITAITAPPKSAVVPPRVNPIVTFFIDDWNQLDFNELPRWIAEKIAQSEEYKKKHGDVSAPVAKKNSDFDDDIPF